MGDLDAWRKWFKESGAAKHWNIFVGPCAHGREPYTRCDICEPLGQEEAKKLAVAAAARRKGI